MSLVAAVWLIARTLPPGSRITAVRIMFAPIASPFTPKQPQEKVAKTQEGASSSATNKAPPPLPAAHSKGGPKPKGKAKAKGEGTAEWEEWDEDDYGVENTHKQSAMRKKERKLLEQLSLLALKLDEERAQSCRDNNFVLEMPSSHDLARKMEWTAEHYREAGEKAWEEAKGAEGKEKAWRGHPLGKKPVAMLQGLLYRLAEFLEAPGMKDKVVEAAAGAEQEGKEERMKKAFEQLQSLAGIGKVASTSGFRTTRCFTVKYKKDGGEGEEEEDEDMAEEYTKWIFATPDVQLNQVMENVRDSKLLDPLGISLGSDFGPRSREAKEIGRLAFGKGKGKGKGKSGGMFSRKT